MIVCVRCGREVKGPEPGVGGVPMHTGHVDSAQDVICGSWWAYREVKDTREKD